MNVERTIKLCYVVQPCYTEMHATNRLEHLFRIPQNLQHFNWSLKAAFHQSKAESGLKTPVFHQWLSIRQTSGMQPLTTVVALLFDKGEVHV